MFDSSSLTDDLTSLLLENLRDHTIFMIDTQGRILTWAPSIKRLFGYDETEFVGQQVEIIFLPEDRKREVPSQEMEKARQQERAEDLRWHVRKDGTLFWANGQLIALRNEAQGIKGFAKILRDDTPRKLLEDKLQEATDRLQSALDAGSIGTWRWDLQSDRVVADSNLARFFEVSAEDAAGGPVAHYIDSIHADDIERVLVGINESIESDRPFAEDYRLVQSDGSLLWVEARGKIEKDEAGVPQRLDGVVLDITARKKVEAALGKSEQRYRTLFNSIDSAFCVVQVLFDASGQAYDYKFLEINPAFEAQTGLADAVGRTARELVPGLDQYWFDIYGRVAQTGEPVRFENRAGAMNRWFDVYAFPADEFGSHKVAILFNDISARKSNEEVLRLAHEKSEETNRLKDEFLATLSHELRSPLNAILGWANLLRVNKMDQDTQNEGLEVIERNAHAQAKLIEDLLDVSRILTGKLRVDLQPVEASRILEEAVLNATPTAEAKRIQFHTDINHDTGFISGDPQRLAQVFWNLLSNAIKFTPRDGQVWVRLARVESQVQIQITDSGQGITPEFLPYVFERFRQGDASSTRAHGGLGIGLALVKYLVEAHGGTVEAHSPGEGQGATFTIFFPLLSVRGMPDASASEAESELNDEATVAANGTPPLLQHLKILVVDDEADARGIVALTLKRHGATVETASSAGEAFELISAALNVQHPFDVLVSDIGMPEEDGYRLLRRVRDLESQESLLPAIALTAYASPRDRVRALAAGFQMHLSKPVDAVELVASVASLVGRTGYEV